MSNPVQFGLKIQMARRSYDQTGDRYAFLADCVNAALGHKLSELMSHNPRLRLLSNGLVLSGGAVKGAVETIGHHLADPDEHNYTADDVLHEFVHYAKKHYNRDLGPATEVLRHLGLWSDED